MTMSVDSGVAGCPRPGTTLLGYCLCVEVECGLRSALDALPALHLHWMPYCPALPGIVSPVPSPGPGFNKPIGRRTVGREDWKVAVFHVPGCGLYRSFTGRARGVGVGLVRCAGGRRVGCSVAAVVVAAAVGRPHPIRPVRSGPGIPIPTPTPAHHRASTTHQLVSGCSPRGRHRRTQPRQPLLLPLIPSRSSTAARSPPDPAGRSGQGCLAAMTMKQPRGRQEPRRMGNAAMVVTMLVSLCVLTYIKARYCSNPFPKPAEELEVVEVDEDYDSTRYKLSGPIGEEDFDPSRPTCYNTSKRSERCAAVGDIRVDGNHSRIYISPLSREWKTKPYARLHDPVAMDDVREFTLVPFGPGSPNGTVVPPLCTRNHSVPGFLFSSGGFAGNLYHDYADVLVPLFASTHHFGGEVQFLLADIKDWWADKFKPLFRQLSRYDVIDVNNDREVHCFPRIVIGSTFHRAMGIDASRSPGGETVADFKRVLRRAFKLERAVASRSGAPRRKDRPRLLIISRKSSRRFVNERAMARAAAAAKFDVRIAEPDNHTDMPNFARLVNSADVMMGVHGAGLTNMVFLPSRAVLVQVVPFGGLEWLTRVTFKDPARDMDVTYMEYNVSLEESSLRDLYPEDHFYLKHPYDVHKKGWDAIKTVYLDKQNVRLNLTRFTRTLEQARDLLPSP